MKCFSIIRLACFSKLIFETSTYSFFFNVVLNGTIDSW